MAISRTLGPVVGEGKRGGDLPLLKNRAGLLTNWIFESTFSAQVCSLWRFFRLYARGVDDEERCCGQCGRGRCAEKARIFPDRRGFAQVADIYLPRGKGDARCRFGGDLRV